MALEKTKSISKQFVTIAVTDQQSLIIRAQLLLHKFII